MTTSKKKNQQYVSSVSSRIGFISEYLLLSVERDIIYWFSF